MFDAICTERKDGGLWTGLLYLCAHAIQQQSPATSTGIMYMPFTCSTSVGLSTLLIPTLPLSVTLSALFRYCWPN